MKHKLLLLFILICIISLTAVHSLPLGLLISIQNGRLGHSLVKHR